MADEAGVMVTSEGRPTPLMIARWHAKSPNVALQPQAVLVDRDGVATETFRRFWRSAFALREALPVDAVVDRAGRFTKPMLDVWE